MAGEQLVTIKGHKAGRGGHFCVYSVYDKKTTLPIIIDGTAAECAKVMDVSESTFYGIVSRQRHGKDKGRKWEIWQRFCDRKGDVRIG